LNTLSFALIGLAALLAPGFNRRGPWPRLLAAIAGVVVVQALIMALGSLTEQHLALIPLLYVAAIAPSVICLAVLVGVRPRRPRRAIVAAPA
jgi:lipopolysaccharide export system permease protein